MSVKINTHSLSLFFASQTLMQTLYSQEIIIISKRYSPNCDQFLLAAQMQWHLLQFAQLGLICMLNSWTPYKPSLSGQYSFLESSDCDGNSHTVKAQGVFVPIVTLSLLEAKQVRGSSLPGADLEKHFVCHHPQIHMKWIPNCPPLSGLHRCPV